ncbi:hypothetical protein ACS0TY_014679 [Phlomoides rotata]
METDSEIAFNLQMEEALTDSLLDDAVSSPNTTDLTYDAVFGAALSTVLQNDDLYKYEVEILDQYKTEVEAKRLRLDLCRQVHDRAFACEISTVSEADWRKNGDNLTRPYGEGSSSSKGQTLGFRVYVKGLVQGMVGGIGVAIRDWNDNLVFELNKGLGDKENRVNEEIVELKALIEGLDAAVVLDLKGVTIVTDNPLLYQCITGKNPPIFRGAAALSSQIDLLLRKLSHTRTSLVSSQDIKSAVDLARKAIISEVNRSAAINNAKKLSQTCTICLEDTNVDEMFLIAGCQHSYCFSCMSKHVQFQLLHGILPECPHENCKSALKLESCTKFLSPELFHIMSQHLKEASIPISEKIYCPFARCSALLSRNELQRPTGDATVLWGRTCPRCGGIFCLNCKVPWHSHMSCADFKRLDPYPCTDEKKLKTLATENMWRQCPKCNHMVSLAEGCYHIHCRCGHEFCYTCGAEWTKKKPTCTCPIWDEGNLLHNRRNR